MIRICVTSLIVLIIVNLIVSFTIIFYFE